MSGLALLPASGLVIVVASCPHCDDLLTVEATTGARTTAVGRVAASLSCERCRATYLFVGELALAGGSPHKGHGPHTTKRPSVAEAYKRKVQGDATS